MNGFSVIQVIFGLPKCFGHCHTAFWVWMDNILGSMFHWLSGVSSPINGTVCQISIAVQ